MFFLIFRHFFPKCTFLSPSHFPFNSILQWQYISIRSTFLMKHFSSYYQNAFGHQTLQGGDMLRGAPTHKYAWHLKGVGFWGHVTSKYISTCRRCINTTLGKVLTKFKRLPNMTLWVLFVKSTFSIFTDFIANKIGRLLTLGGLFSVQTKHLVSI